MRAYKQCKQCPDSQFVYFESILGYSIHSAGNDLAKFSGNHIKICSPKSKALEIAAVCFWRGLAHFHSENLLLQLESSEKLWKLWLFWDVNGMNMNILYHEYPEEGDQLAVGWDYKYWPEGS